MNALSLPAFLSSLITVRTTENGVQKTVIHVVARCTSDDSEMKFALRRIDKNSDNWG